jgi:GT2 family glycosyltransferase
LFIVNNNGRDEITEELNELAKIDYPFIGKIKVCHLPSNLGVSGAWNLIIKSYLMSPYWIICNNDLAFTPGFLEEMVDKSLDDNIEIVWPPSINSDYVQNGLGSFECFLIKDSVVQKCGLFDENLYPAYCEDCDYLVKIKSNNIKSEYVYSLYYHGETQSYESGSQTLKIESSQIGQKIHDAHMLNIGYMTNTWGSDWEKWENYASKNNKIEIKLYDIDFNRKKYLGF